MYSLACMSAGTEVYTNAAERWHITVFHTSQFDDTRPHPLEPMKPDMHGKDQAQRCLPTFANLQQEQETVHKVISESQPLVLEVRTHMDIHFVHWSSQLARTKHNFGNCGCLLWAAMHACFQFQRQLLCSTSSLLAHGRMLLGSTTAVPQGLLS